MSGQFHNPIKNRKKRQNQYMAAHFPGLVQAIQLKNGEAKLVIWTQVFHIGEIHVNCNLVMF